MATAILNPNTTDTLSPQHDLCDRCNAAALVRLGHATNGVLDFCGHHFRKHEDVLITAGWQVVIDDRDRLVDENKLVGSEN